MAAGLAAPVRHRHRPGARGPLFHHRARSASGIHGRSGAPSAAGGSACRHGRGHEESSHLAAVSDVLLSVRRWIEQLLFFLPYWLEALGDQQLESF